MARSGSHHSPLSSGARTHQDAHHLLLQTFKILLVMKHKFTFSIVYIGPQAHFVPKSWCVEPLWVNNKTVAVPHLLMNLRKVYNFPNEWSIAISASLIIILVQLCPAHVFLLRACCLTDTESVCLHGLCTSGAGISHFVIYLSVSLGLMTHHGGVTTTFPCGFVIKSYNIPYGILFWYYINGHYSDTIL